MIKVLRLAWIAKLLRVYGYVFRTILAYIFKKYGGLHFLLSCNYDAKDFENVPSFYKDILLFFHELKALHGCHHGRDIILFNNKEILTDGRPFFWKEWFKKGIRTIKDLLDKNEKSYLVQRDGIKPFLWTVKQTGRIYSNQYRRLVEQIELGNFILNSFI